MSHPDPSQGTVRDRPPTDAELLALVAASTAPSNDVDYAVTLWLGEVDAQDWNRANTVRGYRCTDWFRLEPPSGPHAHVVANWTGSLDAATALAGHVLPGWRWTISGGHGPTAAAMRDDGTDPRAATQAEGRHPCVVALHAVIDAKVARNGA